MANTRNYPIIYMVILCVFTVTPLYPESPVQQLDLKLPSTDSKKQKSRMRKTTSKSADAEQKTITSYRDLNYQQLLESKNQAVVAKNSTVAIKYLKQLINLCDPEEAITIGNHELEIADILFQDKQYRKAAHHYAEFTLLHPGSEKLQYALYQTITSSFYCMLPFDRDQTKTEETLALAESFLKQDHFTTYQQQVEEIAESCRTKLIESDINVCLYHLKRGHLNAAEKRIVLLKDTWGSHLDATQDTVTLLETDLNNQRQIFAAKSEKNIIVAQQKKTKRMTERF